MGQGFALGGDRAGDIARGQPHGHRDGGGDSHVRLGGMDYVEITDYRTVADKLKYLL